MGRLYNLAADYDRSRFGSGRMRRRARSVNTARKPIRPVIAKTSSSGQVRMRRRLPAPRLTQSVQVEAMMPGTNQTTANVAAGNPKYQRRQPRQRSKMVNQMRPAKPAMPRERSATFA